MPPAARSWTYSQFSCGCSIAITPNRRARSINSQPFREGTSFRGAKGDKDAPGNRACPFSVGEEPDGIEAYGLTAGIVVRRAILTPMSRRFQFSLRGLLVAMLVVASFFGGMSLQGFLARPIARHHYELGLDGEIKIDWTEMRDGTRWYKVGPGGLLTLWNEPIDNAPDEKGNWVVDHMRLPDGSHWQRVED